MSEAVGLVAVEKINPVELFSTQESVDAAIGQIRARVAEFVPDLRTSAGRKEIASMAYKVTRSKTYLDEIGKNLVAEMKAKVAEVDAKRRHVRVTLDEIAAEVRRPLDAWEVEDKKRKDVHEQLLDEIWSVRPSVYDTVEELDAKVEKINNLMDREWEEYKKKAFEASNTNIREIQTFKSLAEQRKAEREQMEQQRRELEEERRKLEEERRAASQTEPVEVVVKRPAETPQIKAAEPEPEDDPFGTPSEPADQWALAKRTLAAWKSSNDKRAQAVVRYVEHLEANQR